MTEEAMTAALKLDAKIKEINTERAKAIKVIEELRSGSFMYMNYEEMCSLRAMVNNIYNKKVDPLSLELSHL